MYTLTTIIPSSHSSLILLLSHLRTSPHNYINHKSRITIYQTGQQFLNETSQFFHDRADSLEKLEGIESSNNNFNSSGDKCITELSDYVKEEIENVKFIPRLVMNRNTKEFEEVLLDPEYESPGGVHVTESAQALRVKLGAMTVEEREAWRSDALVPNTVPYSG